MLVPLGFVSEMARAPHIQCGEAKNWVLLPSCTSSAKEPLNNIPSFQHNVLPTCLYEDPSWYISTPLGYNLGGQKKPLWNKYNATKHTHSRSKKENKSRIHAEARDWSCNSHGQGNNLPLGLLCFKKKKKENEKRLQASSYTLRDADLLFYCCFSAVS